ncbi:multidrug DMT transporter permease [Labrys miyagiensis]|uniref:Multidrug DMT transporter permease n=1 Tax=Labrys miyagiensis TaxID=346912 RepID=A0ABQ6CU57_9HYPH|nr:DMT family transporter [Labrys miyagiensis]GLS22525.1 multidrug DMT transporter permease [Labrys miyagiensis]
MSDTILKVRPSDAAALGAFDFSLYALVVFVWGTSWIALHLQLGVVAPEVSLFWRFLIAAVVMLVWVAATGNRLRFAAAEHLRFALMGLLLFSTNFLCFYYGGLSTPSGLLAVVFSLASVFNIVLGALIFRQKPRLRAVIAGLMGFGGVGLMFAPQLTGASLSGPVLGGLTLCVAGTLCFCLGNMLSVGLKARAIPLPSATTWGMVYGALFLLLFSLVRGQDFIIEPNIRYLGALLWSALLSSVAAFAAYLTLLSRIGASRAGYSTVLFPVIALAISTIYEGYAWTGLAITGLVIVIAGNLLMLTKTR